MNNDEIRQNKFWSGVILYNPASKEVLLHKRDSNIEVNPNMWGFFGGVNEPGEAPEDCVVREVKEELDVTIDKTLLKPFSDYLNEERMTWRYCYVMNFAKNKSEMELGEGADFDWVSLEDALLKYDLTDKTRLDLETFKATL